MCNLAFFVVKHHFIKLTCTEFEHCGIFNYDIEKDFAEIKFSLY